jgi:hypothetical protein
MKMAVFWVVAPCSLVKVYRRFGGSSFNIALMMEAAVTSEKSVNFYQTTRGNNPEDSHLHTRRRENLKSHSFDEVLGELYIKYKQKRPDVDQNEVSPKALVYTAHISFH